MAQGNPYISLRMHAYKLMNIRERHLIEEIIDGDKISTSER